MHKLLLIDSSFILWKTVPNKVLSKEKKEQGMEPYKKSYLEICELIDWYITEKIIKPTGTDSFIGFLDGKDNFRKKLAPDTYKVGRSLELPQFFHEAKTYMIKNWGFVKVDGIEAEDAVNITYNKLSKLYPDTQIIIVSQDHDLKQIAATHFNPCSGESGEWNIIDKTAAKEFLGWFQLAGCQTDRVLGLKKGIGEVKAKQYLEGIPLDKQIHKILDLFIEEYGEYNGIVNFAKNYQLLKILDDLEEFEVPKIQSVNDLIESGVLYSTPIKNDEEIDFEI